MVIVISAAYAAVPHTESNAPTMPAAKKNPLPAARNFVILPPLYCAYRYCDCYAGTAENRLIESALDALHDLNMRNTNSNEITAKGKPTAIR